jgi:hypothetical protein
MFFVHSASHSRMLRVDWVGLVHSAASMIAQTDTATSPGPSTTPGGTSHSSCAGGRTSRRRTGTTPTPLPRSGGPQATTTTTLSRRWNRYANSRMHYVLYFGIPGHHCVTVCPPARLTELGGEGFASLQAIAFFCLWTECHSTVKILRMVGPKFGVQVQAMVGKDGKRTQYSQPYGWAYGDMMMTGGEGCTLYNPKHPKHCPGQTDNEYVTYCTCQNSPCLAYSFVFKQFTGTDFSLVVYTCMRDCVCFLDDRCCYC